MWDLPGPGVEPVSPPLAGRFCTMEPPGKPIALCIYELIDFPGSVSVCEDCLVVSTITGHLCDPVQFSELWCIIAGSTRSVSPLCLEEHMLALPGLERRHGWLGEAAGLGCGAELTIFCPSP